MTSIELLEMNNRTLLVPEEINPQIGYRERIERWQAKAEKILSDRSEVMIPYQA